MIITVFLNIVVVLLTCLSEKNKVTRVTYLAFNLAFFCYSCIGIYTNNIDESFYVSYIVSMITMNVFFVIGNHTYNAIYEKRTLSGVNGITVRYNNSTNKIDRINDTLTQKSSIIRVLAIVYILIRASELFYPEFSLKYLFTGPNLLYGNLLETTRANYHTIFGHLLSTIKTLLLPFAYMYISTKSNKIVLCYFAFDLICVYLTGHASIGRLTVIQVLIVMSLFFYSKSKNQAERARNRIIVIVVCILSFMIYVFLQNIRSGNVISFSSINPIEAIKSFAKSEFFYPRNYPMAQELYEKGAYKSSTFWLWLITLPIPKAFLTIPGVDETTSAIYRVFSYYYFGGHWYYEPGIGGMLISVLGDGIMVYGKYLSFIIMIPFAFFLSFYLSFLRRLKYGKLLYYTTFFQFVVSFRPGVQYALTKINSFVAIVLIIFLIRRIRTNSKYVMEE